MGNFRRYFWARTLSVFGDAMLPVVLTAVVLAGGYGVSGVGLVLGTSLLPSILLMMFTGVLADRFGARPMMVAADAARFIVQMILAVLLLTGTPSLGLIIGLQLVYGTATAAFQPGVGSMITAIVTDVQRSNGKVKSAEALMTMCGPAVGGLILVIADTSVVVFVDALTFFISGALLYGVRMPQQLASPRRTSVFRDAVEGWSEFIRRPWLWRVILTFCLFGFFVFGPYIVLSAAGITERHGSVAYGVMVGLSGFGGVVGGRLAGRIRPRYPLRIAVGFLSLVAFPFALLALNAPLPLIGIAYIAGGLGRGVWSVMWITTEQSHVPPEVLNRIYAFDVTGSIVLLPVGRAVAGSVAPSLGFATTLWICAVAAVAGCAAMAMAPSIRNLRHRSEHDDSQLPSRV